jgi:DNA-binding response OmpR family regulator
MSNKGLDYEPRVSEDKNWENRKVWERIVDTTINRLRAVVEPDPQKPIYLLSERGKGFIKLENTRD